QKLSRAAAAAAAIQDVTRHKFRNAIKLIASPGSIDCGSLGLHGFKNQKMSLGLARMLVTVMLVQRVSVRLGVGVGAGTGDGLGTGLGRGLGDGLGFGFGSLSLISMANLQH